MLLLAVGDTQERCQDFTIKSNHYETSAFELRLSDMTQTWKSIRRRYFLVKLLKFEWKKIVLIMPLTLHLRSETKPLEHRSALTPDVVRELLKEPGKFVINVERSPGRIFDVSCPKL